MNAPHPPASEGPAIPPLRLFSAASATALLIIVLGMALRVSWMHQSVLWCDEAESAINGLTILQTGLPKSEYLSLPVYENTLTDLWPEHPEYEFRDSSYSAKGLAVYHGWLPLYAIAASQALFGMAPDIASDPPAVRHGASEIRSRTNIPRYPALLFSLGCLVMIYLLAHQLGGAPTALSALTLMAFNAKTVDFGIQARYYSLTLLATVLAAWALLQVCRRGRWRDFFFLGLCEAILFHTHQFSAVVFAGACVISIPAIIRQPRWFVKSLAGGSLSAILILPWVVLSGFLTTASHVPKAYKLFSSFTDWLSYSLERPDQLIIMTSLATLLLICSRAPHVLPTRLAARLLANRGIYTILLGWMVVGYGMFHLIVPAASFFYERLSLVLWTPYVLMLALAASDLLAGIGLRRVTVWAVALMLLFLMARNRAAFLGRTSIPTTERTLAPIVATLSAKTFEPGTKFYANPNAHLIYTYFMGLPVQSVMPVRRSFLETYPHPIVFIEGQMQMFIPSEEVVLSAFPPDHSLTGQELYDVQTIVWETLTRESLKSRGLTMPETRAFPSEWLPALEGARAESRMFHEGFLRDASYYMVLRNLNVKTLRDIWLAFFVRFVDPLSRIGEHQNIMPRLKTATLVPLPIADTIIYFSPPPETTNSNQMN